MIEPKVYKALENITLKVIETANTRMDTVSDISELKDVIEIVCRCVEVLNAVDK